MIGCPILKWQRLFLRTGYEKGSCTNKRWRHWFEIWLLQQPLCKWIEFEISFQIIKRNLMMTFLFSERGSQDPFKMLWSSHQVHCLKTEVVKRHQIDNNKSCWKCQKSICPHKTVTHPPLSPDFKGFWYSCSSHTSKKLEILEIYLRQFFGFSANFFTEDAEPFKFALCLETALPIFSKLCSDIA